MHRRRNLPPHRQFRPYFPVCIIHPIVTATDEAFKMVQQAPDDTLIPLLAGNKACGEKSLDLETADLARIFQPPAAQIHATARYSATDMGQADLPSRVAANSFCTPCFVERYTKQKNECPTQPKLSARGS
jgi:hypothetical protein